MAMDDTTFFPGFAHRRVATSDAEIELVAGGSGPPLLLVHGYPQTKVLWRKMAPLLAGRFTLVIPDLRGYGASSKPATDTGHSVYSKRAMALDMVEVMAALGHERFLVCGHDRGARVSYRLALDHPEKVVKLAVLDIVPTLEQFERMGMSGGLGSFHWYFLAQPAPFPETLIGKDPDYFMRHMMAKWYGSPAAMEDAAMDHYLAAFRDPAVIHATCEDYRAGATIDCELDRIDRESGRRITCPLLALWGDRGMPHKRADVLDIWRLWADDARGEGLACGHFLPEEAPEATAERLVAFFA